MNFCFFDLPGTLDISGVPGLQSSNFGAIFWLSRVNFGKNVTNSAWPPWYIATFCYYDVTRISGYFPDFRDFFASDPITIKCLNNLGLGVTLLLIRPETIFLVAKRPSSLDDPVSNHKPKRGFTRFIARIWTIAKGNNIKRGLKGGRRNFFPNGRIKNWECYWELQRERSPNLNWKFFNDDLMWFSLFLAGIHVGRAEHVHAVLGLLASGQPGGLGAGDHRRGHDWRRR